MKCDNDNCERNAEYSDVDGAYWCLEHAHSLCGRMNPTQYAWLNHMETCNNCQEASFLSEQRGSSFKERCVMCCDVGRPLFVQHIKEFKRFDPAGVRSLYDNNGVKPVRGMPSLKDGHGRGCILAVMAVNAGIEETWDSHQTSKAVIAIHECLGFDESYLHGLWRGFDGYSLRVPGYVNDKSYFALGYKAGAAAWDGLVKPEMIGFDISDAPFRHCIIDELIDPLCEEY